MDTKIDEELIRNLSHLPITGKKRDRVVFRIDGNLYSPYPFWHGFQIYRYKVLESGEISIGHLGEWNDDTKDCDTIWDEPRKVEVVGYIPLYQDLMIYLIKKGINPSDLRYDMMAPSVLDQRDYIKKQIISYIRKP